MARPLHIRPESRENRRQVGGNCRPPVTGTEQKNGKPDLHPVSHDRLSCAAGDMVANNIANMDTTAFKREMNINQSYDERIRFGERLAFVLDVGMPSTSRKVA